MVSKTVAQEPLTLQTLHTFELPVNTRLQSEEPQPKAFHKQGIPQSHRPTRLTKTTEKGVKTRSLWWRPAYLIRRITESYRLPENVAFSKYMFSDLKEIYIPLEILQPSQHSKDINAVMVTQGRTFLPFPKDFNQCHTSIQREDTVIAAQIPLFRLVRITQFKSSK